MAYVRAATYTAWSGQSCAARLTQEQMTATSTGSSSWASRAISWRSYSPSWTSKTWMESARNWLAGPVGAVLGAAAEMDEHGLNSLARAERAVGGVGHQSRPNRSRVVPRDVSAAVEVAWVLIWRMVIPFSDWVPGLPRDRPACSEPRLSGCAITDLR